MAKVSIVCVQCGESVRMNESEVRRFGGRCVICFRESGEPYLGKSVKKAKTLEKSSALKLLGPIFFVVGIIVMALAIIPLLAAVQQKEQAATVTYFLAAVLTGVSGLTLIGFSEACSILVKLEERTRDKS